jgi:hypothetical protein
MDETALREAEARALAADEAHHYGCSRCRPIMTARGGRIIRCKPGRELHAAWSQAVGERAEAEERRRR